MANTVAEFSPEELKELYWVHLSDHFRNDYDKLILKHLNKSAFLKTFYIAMEEFLNDIKFNSSDPSSISLLKQLLIDISEDVAKIIYEEFDRIHSYIYGPRFLLEKIFAAGKPESTNKNDSGIRNSTKAEMKQLNHYLFEEDIYLGEGDDIDMQEYTHFHALLLAELSKYLTMVIIFTREKNEALSILNEMREKQKSRNNKISESRIKMGSSRLKRYERIVKTMKIQGDNLNNAVTKICNEDAIPGQRQNYISGILDWTKTQIIKNGPWREFAISFWDLHSPDKLKSLLSESSKNIK